MPSMRSKRFLVFVTMLALAGGGCARVSETARVVWGSSTRALEEARADAISKTYQCSYEDCYKEALKIVKLEKLEVFIADRVKGHMVVMGIKGAVNTTEVGIFFSPVDENKLKVEITSLSTNAKKKMAAILFPRLAAVYAEVQ